MLLIFWFSFYTILKSEILKSLKKSQKKKNKENKRKNEKEREKIMDLLIKQVDFWSKLFYNKGGKIERKKSKNRNKRKN